MCKHLAKQNAFPFIVNLPYIATNIFIMSKIKFIAILFLIASCSSESETSIQSEPTILGSWVGVESFLNGESMGEPNNDRVEFFSDNTVEFYYDEHTEYGDYSLKNNILTITWESAETGLETYILEINELTENTLRWETEIEGEGNLVEVFER